jgi:hypothetical protein
MASGHRKRKAAAIRAYVLNPANLTNVPEADRGVKLDQDNRVVMAVIDFNGELDDDWEKE